MQSSVRNRSLFGVTLAISLFLAGTTCAVPVIAQAPPPAVNTAAPAAINNAQDLVQWMTYYYMHPQPDLLVPALVYADSTGLVDKGQAPLTAFVSRVFAQNPQRISSWATQLQTLSGRSKPMLWSALWWSNTVEGHGALEELMKGLDDKQATVVLSQMAHPATPIEQMDLNKPEVLDELWGAYSATGDEKYVKRIFVALPWAYENKNDLNRMTIGSAARWSLTSNAQQHPSVLKICINARQSQPELKPILDKIIAGATKGAPVQTGQSGPAL